MLGTPNHGSFTIPEVITGALDTVRKIAILDVTHNRAELLSILNTFPGSLQMLPSPLVLPGMEVTEPGDWQFFLFGRWEGNPRCDHRSTVAPNYRRDVWYAKHDAIRDVKMQHSFQQSEQNFVVGPHGFSQ